MGARRKLLDFPLVLVAISRAGEAHEPCHDDESEPGPAQFGPLETDTDAEEDQANQRQ